VIIDEAQPRGVLLRIKGTARRAVTWHHADVSLHRTQYQNLFHPGHGASATGNIVFPANDTRPESSHAPDCEPPATSPSASAPAARVTSDGHGERDARVRGGGRWNLPREAPCPRGMLSRRKAATARATPASRTSATATAEGDADSAVTRAGVFSCAVRAPDHTVTRLDLSRLRVWCEMPPINGCARRGTSVKGDL